MRLRFSRRAILDLVGIADYIRERNPRAAATVEERIRASIEELAIFPFTGRATNDPSIRMFPIARYPILCSTRSSKARLSFITFVMVAADRLILARLAHPEPSTISSSGGSLS
jgi:plasmid stabilization system protein ParE